MNVWCPTGDALGERVYNSDLVIVTQSKPLVVKGVIYPKMISLSSFTVPHVVSTLHYFLLSETQNEMLGGTSTLLFYTQRDW